VLIKLDREQPRQFALVLNTSPASSGRHAPFTKRKSPAEAGLRCIELLPFISGSGCFVRRPAVRPVRASASAGRVAGSGSAGRRRLADHLDRLDSDFADSLESSSGVCGGNVVQRRDADPCSCCTTLCVSRGNLTLSVRGLELRAAEVR
jgi:hypothetical protein